jgi:hypothetical protein
MVDPFFLATSWWRIEDRPERRPRLLKVADLRCLEQAQTANHGVRDVLVAQAGHDRLAMFVLPIEDGDVRPAAPGFFANQRLDGIDDRDGLVLSATADDELDRVARATIGDQALVRLEPEGVVGRLEITSAPRGPAPLLRHADVKLRQNRTGGRSRDARPTVR